METKEQSGVLQIKMLGGFEIRRGGCVLGDDNGRSHQLWNLLEYLVAYRHKDISQTAIIEALWPDEGSDNPTNALKNLVYRIRSAFTAAGFPDGKDMIRISGGSYSLNRGQQCVVDTEEFEALCKQGDDPQKSREERCGLLLKALELYKGDFLPKSSFESWVVPLSTYYHNLYLRTVEHAVELLRQLGRNEAIVKVCEEALLIDRYEEDIYTELIRALIALGRQKQAMEQYQEVSELYYREMGVHPSEKLRNLYREIIKTVNMVETDLQVIKEDLREAGTVQGAFVCEYEVFKNMYQLEARAAERTGQAVFLALITLSSADGEMDTRLMKTAMERLLETLKGSLRRGDVVARFSATQYVLMLYTLAYENGEMVLERISRRYAANYRNPRVRLNTTLQPLDPIHS